MNDRTNERTTSGTIGSIAELAIYAAMALHASVDMIDVQRPYDCYPEVVAITRPDSEHLAGGWSLADHRHLGGRLSLRVIPDTPVQTVGSVYL